MLFTKMETKSSSQKMVITNNFARVYRSFAQSEKISKRHFFSFLSLVDNRNDVRAKFFLFAISSCIEQKEKVAQRFSVKHLLFFHQIGKTTNQFLCHLCIHPFADFRCLLRFGNTFRVKTSRTTPFHLSKLEKKFTRAVFLIQKCALSTGVHMY